MVSHPLPLPSPLVPPPSSRPPDPIPRQQPQLMDMIIENRHVSTPSINHSTVIPPTSSTLRTKVMTSNAVASGSGWVQPEVKVSPKAKFEVFVPMTAKKFIDGKKPQSARPKLVSSVLPSKAEYGVLQADMLCPWAKCDARMANVIAAKKHYARHQSKVRGKICGIRGCTHLLPDLSAHTLEKHYTLYHLPPFKPCQIPGKEQGVRPRRPQLRHSLPPLPTSLVPSYLLTTAPIRPTPLSKPDQPLSITTTINPSLLPLELRQKRARSNSIADTVQAKHSIHPEYGDVPFEPVQGDAIVESVRYSSYIFSHPAEYSNCPGGVEAIRQFAAMSPSNNTSTLPTIPFPMVDGSRSASASSSRTAVSLLAGSQDPDSLPLSGKSLSKADGHHLPVETIPDDAQGRFGLTVPLADVFARAKREKPPDEVAEPAAPPPWDRKRRSEWLGAYGRDKIRRIAERTASEALGKTIGMDWWEVMFEVEKSLREAVAEPIEDDGP